MKVAIFQFDLFGINTYVVYDPVSKECAIIDPGMMSPREEQALVEFIDRNQLKVTHLINTHLHVDHAIGDAFVVDKYGLPVEAHADDEFLGSRMRQQAESFGLPPKAADVTVSQYLSEGDVIHIGDGELEVLHVPGHSPGSIVLYDRKDGFLIAGDVLFQGSIGRTDLPGGSHQQLINGIREKLLPLPDATVVYPGHGPATTIGDERRYNPYL